MTTLRKKCIAAMCLVWAGIVLAPQTASAQATRLVQFGSDGNRLRPMDANALPVQIERLPDIDAQMKVIQRRSQLMITRPDSPVVRSAVADPRIVDIVQFSPNELAFIGLQLGTTTVFLWFE